MRILVTGSEGFIGKNLINRFKQIKGFSISVFNRKDSLNDLKIKIYNSDLIIHLAGVNRPKEDTDFKFVNVGLTQSICNFISKKNSNTLLILASSTQAELNNPYGKSKYAAELLVSEMFQNSGNPVAIFRFPGIFGKWCKPNYNSVIATFCHNIAHNLPIRIDDPSKILRLVYIDDVIDKIKELIDFQFSGCVYPNISPEYYVSLGDIEKQIKSFKNYNDRIIIENIDANFARALHTTYLSYLP